MDEIPVSAWRCEECRNWHSASEGVNEILVLDVGPDIVTGEIAERAFFARRLRVCGDCRAEITQEKLGFQKR
jgi:hypothetical protein